MIVFWFLNYNQNSSHPPGPHVTQGPGNVHQPRTDIGQSRSTGPQPSQGPYTHPGQTVVSLRSTGPSIRRRASPPGGRTPARDRQRSVPGQLVPPVTGWPAHHLTQPVPEQIVIRADPSVITLATLDQPTVPDPLLREPSPSLGQAPYQSGDEPSLPPNPYSERSAQPVMLT